MSGIKNKNTKPELMIRGGLHVRGFRFRIHSPNSPGKPDLALARYRAAIFVHGCFWHGHNCHLFKMPSTRPEFWRAKIARNVERDKRVSSLLLQSGWRHLVIWECALKGKSKLDFEALMDYVHDWINGDTIATKIVGAPLA